MTFIAENLIVLRHFLAFILPKGRALQYKFIKNVHLYSALRLLIRSQYFFHVK